MPTAEVYKYYQNTLVLMMMSPPRYHLVQLVQRHYAPFFRHMDFFELANDAAVHPTYEEMNVQFYWGKGSAESCDRRLMSTASAAAATTTLSPETVLFTNDTMRWQLAKDQKLIAASKRIGGLVSVPSPPFKFK